MAFRVAYLLLLLTILRPCCLDLIAVGFGHLALLPQPCLVGIQESIECVVLRTGQQGMGGLYIFHQPCKGDVSAPQISLPCSFGALLLMCCPWRFCINHASGRALIIGTALGNLDGVSMGTSAVVFLSASHWTLSSTVSRYHDFYFKAYVHPCWHRFLLRLGYMHHPSLVHCET